MPLIADTDNFDIEFTHIITIDVTQEHIDQGNPIEVFKCPISLALQERFPGYYAEVFDSDGKLNMTRRNDDTPRSWFQGTYEVGTMLEDWVRRYDQERDTGPCKIKLSKTVKRDGNFCDVVYHDDPELREEDYEC